MPKKVQVINPIGSLQQDKLQVAAYCRVSSNSEDQRKHDGGDALQNSIGFPMSMLKSFINYHASRRSKCIYQWKP